MEKLGHDAAKAVDWSAPRLLCIAGDFTRYDEHAVKQIARNIELLRYRRFGHDLLMIELVHAPKQARPSSSAQTSTNANDAAVQPTSAADGSAIEDKYKTSRIAYRLAQSSIALQDVFGAIRDYLVALGDDVQVKELSYYVAFKRIKNFACLEIYPQAKVIVAFLKVDPATVALEEGFTRDVTKIGHFGTGNLEVTIRSMDDFARAQPLFVKSYEGS
jgi:predicted transport protein